MNHRRGTRKTLITRETEQALVNFPRSGDSYCGGGLLPLKYPPCCAYNLKSSYQDRTALCLNSSFPKVCSPWYLSERSIYTFEWQPRRECQPAWRWFGVVLFSAQESIEESMWISVWIIRIKSLIKSCRKATRIFLYLTLYFYSTQGLSAGYMWFWDIKA